MPLPPHVVARASRTCSVHVSACQGRARPDVPGIFRTMPEDAGGFPRGRNGVGRFEYAPSGPFCFFSESGSVCSVRALAHPRAAVCKVLGETEPPEDIEALKSKAVSGALTLEALIEQLKTRKKIRAAEARKLKRIENQGLAGVVSVLVRCGQRSSNEKASRYTSCRDAFLGRFKPVAISVPKRFLSGSAGEARPTNPCRRHSRRAGCCDSLRPCADARECR